MSLLAMPMLLVNAGCEMLYILDQRLKAQNIAPEKSCRVLHDVVRTMFNPEYVTMIFTPQEVYTVSSTRKIFERLAHSSIMRLSESSMEKLFDLMLMGFKYQVLCAGQLSQMMEVTLLHLNTIRRMMAAISDASIASMVNNVEKLMRQTYGDMTQGQLHLVRQTLMRFFQDKRVKVSLFLQEGIQSASGRLILQSPIAPNVGTVAYMDSSGTAVASKEKLSLKRPAVDANEFFIHPEPLGSNLYDKERVKVVPPARSFDAAPSTSAPTPDAGEVTKGTSAGGASLYAEEAMEKGGKDARKELNLLTALLAIQSKAQAADNFKLNLFGDDDAPGGGKGSAAGGVISFGDGDHNAYKQQILSGVKAMTLKDQAADDNLLDLMDNA